MAFLLFSLTWTSFWAESVKYTVSKHLWSALFNQIILFHLRLYTVKYIFKGALKARLRLTVVPDKDELTLYIRSLQSRNALTEWRPWYFSYMFENRYTKYQHSIFIWRRDPSKSMEMLYVTAGEIWCLRLLLLHRACVSFVDFRTVDWVTHRTLFQEGLQLDWWIVIARFLYHFVMWCIPQHLMKNVDSISHSRCR